MAEQKYGVIQEQGFIVENGFREVSDEENEKLKKKKEQEEK